MPAGVALGSIYAALRTVLLSEAAVDALLARDKRNGALPGIYTEGAVPDGAAMPYVTIGAGTQIPAHTMGPSKASPRWGWNCTIQIKVVSQGRGDDEGLAILDAVGDALYEGHDLTSQGSPGSPGMITDYDDAWCDEWVVQPTLVTILAGVPTREFPAILRVIVHD